MAYFEVSAEVATELDILKAIDTVVNNAAMLTALATVPKTSRAAAGSDRESVV